MEVIQYRNFWVVATLWGGDAILAFSAVSSTTPPNFLFYLSHRPSSLASYKADVGEMVKVAGLSGLGSWVWARRAVELTPGGLT